MAANKNILLIGGPWYIGNVMLGDLLKNSLEVRCFDSLIYKNGFWITFFLNNPRYDFIFGNLQFTKALGHTISIVKEKIEALVRLARWYEVFGGSTKKDCFRR